MKDRDAPFMRPLWRRVALVAFCAVWTIWEYWNGETFWAVIVGLVTAYGAWTYLIDYGRKPPPGSAGDAEDRP